MADTWWFEETKLLITLWSEEVVQHELNTMHNKKLVWDKISQEMADGGYSRTVSTVVPVLHSIFFFFWASKLPSCLSSGLQIMAAVRQGTILFSTLDCEVILPGLFEFSQM